MADDPYAERKKLTFAQAEGAACLPQQLALKQVSQELRALLWHSVHTSMEEAKVRNIDIKYARIEEPWSTILYWKHVSRDHKMADDFTNNYLTHITAIRSIFEQGTYVEIFDFVQWLLSLSWHSIDASEIRITLEDSRAAYRLLDDDQTIVPITTDEDAATLNRAFADLARSEFDGARQHLREAARHLTEGDAASSIRESVHAVESVARKLGGTNSLAGALQRLKLKRTLHGAMEQGFKNLYGFTSDEKGIRHPLIDEPSANVDESDALFMIGACSAFVSYLINRNLPDPTG